MRNLRALRRDADGCRDGLLPPASPPPAGWALLLWLSAPRASFAEQLVAHAEGEPQSLVRTAEPVAPGVLDDVLSRSGVRLKPGAGMISYAMSCWFRGQFVPHLVVQSERGPVTVLLLTREADREAA